MLWIPRQQFQLGRTAGNGQLRDQAGRIRRRIHRHMNMNYSDCDVDDVDGASFANE